MDKPTTGLHFSDIKMLLAVLQRLVDVGNTVMVIEHNLDVIKCADWIIDLGPEDGKTGDRAVAEGMPKSVAGNERSHTGICLRAVLAKGISGLTETWKATFTRYPDRSFPIDSTPSPARSQASHFFVYCCAIEVKEVLSQSRRSAWEAVCALNQYHPTFPGD